MHKKILLPKKTSFENSQHMSDFLGFCFVVTLNLYRIPFLAVVVLGSEHEFLFKSTSTHCAVEEQKERTKQIYLHMFFQLPDAYAYCFLSISPESENFRTTFSLSAMHFLFLVCHLHEPPPTVL